MVNTNWSKSQSNNPKSWQPTQTTWANKLTCQEANNPSKLANQPLSQVSNKTRIQPLQWWQPRWGHQGVESKQPPARDQSRAPDPTGDILNARILLLEATKASVRSRHQQGTNQANLNGPRDPTEATPDTSIYLGHQGIRSKPLPARASQKKDYRSSNPTRVTLTKKQIGATKRQIDEGRGKREVGDQGTQPIEIHGACCRHAHPKGARAHGLQRGR